MYQHVPLDIASFYLHNALHYLQYHKIHRYIHKIPHLYEHRFSPKTII